MYGKVLAILASRAVDPGAPPHRGFFEIVDNGSGPQIALWNVAVCGTQPTQGELDAVTDAQAAAAVKALAASRETLTNVVKAIALFYLRDKLGRDPTSQERQSARDALIQAYKDVT